MVKHILIFFAYISLFGTQQIFAQNETDIINYIDKYKGFAIEEQTRTGVPAAITLAQGIHETAAGNSELATQANNHFGIKCKSNWTGETFLHDDDKKQECFRKYSNAQQSYIDHSDFLRAGSRYAFLFDLEITDYVSWASGLKKAGYATNPLYVRKLTELVEKYNLQQYTYDALNVANNKPREVIPNIDAKNPDIVEDPSANYKGLRGFWATKGESLQDRANQNGIKYNRLLEYNDLQDEPLPVDMFVFLEKKKKIGTVEFHMVKEGETMQLISQKEAMNLDNLYTFNNMKRGDIPVVGEQLSLQYRSYGTPKLVQKETPKEEVRIEPVIPPVVVEPTKPPVAKIEKATNADIIDIQKAKKVESILTGKSEDKSEIQITQTEVVKPVVTEVVKPAASEVVKPTASEVKKETAVEPIPEAKKEEVVAEVKVEKKQRPVAPKRTYNEKGIDDSVKILKEKFDNLVYRPFERRPKPVTPKVETLKVETPKAVVSKSTTGITKEPIAKVPAKTTTSKEAPPQKGASAKKDSVGKKTDAKADSSKSKSSITPQEKNTNVEKTNTGIIRDAKKIEEEKRKAKEAEAAKKQKVEDQKKTKSGTQKETKKSEKKPESKKASPKENTKKTETKKPDPKKKDTKKK